MDIQQALTQGIRTAAQAAAGFVAILLLDYLGVAIDQEALTVLLVGVISGVYAVVVTWLAENVNPIFGYLSILPKTPKYSDAIDTTGRQV